MTREDAEKKWDEMSPFVIKALLKVVNKKETTSKKMNKMAVDKETSSINETTEGEAEEADKGDEEGMEEGSEGQSKEDTEKARVDKLTMLVVFFCDIQDLWEDVFKFASVLQSGTRIFFPQTTFLTRNCIWCFIEP